MQQKTNRKIDELIQQSKLTQREFANKMDLSRQRTWDLRVDPANMSVKQMEKMATILRVDFDVIHQIHKDARK